VLAGVLVSASLGSAFSGRFDDRRRQALRWRVVPAIVLLGQGLLIGLDRLSPLAAGFPLAARIAITLLALFPLAFAMGMPFPLGLSAVDDRAPSETPWAIGANGFGSVIGSSGALLLAMIFGYQILMAIGFGLYVVAAIAFPDAGRRADAA
jgi:MFS family permease